MNFVENAAKEIRLNNGDLCENEAEIAYPASEGISAGLVRTTIFR